MAEHLLNLARAALPPATLISSSPGFAWCVLLVCGAVGPPGPDFVHLAVKRHYPSQTKERPTGRRQNRVPGA